MVVCLFIHLASHAPSRETPTAKVFSLMRKLVYTVYTCLDRIEHRTVSTHETYETTRFASVLWVGGPLAGLSHMVTRPWRRIMQLCLSNSVGPTFLNSSNLIYLTLCITFLNSSYYQTNQKNPGTMGPLLSSCWKLCFFVFFWCLCRFGASSGLFFWGGACAGLVTLTSQNIDKQQKQLRNTANISSNLLSLLVHLLLISP